MKNIASHFLSRTALAFLMLALQSQFAQAGEAPWVGDSLWGTPCRGGNQSFGPFDYLLRSQFPKELRLVESAHFTPEIENLNSGNTSKNPMGDLDYTLRAWPNHHRALNSMIRARLRYGNNFPRHKYTPAECYLQRAIRYSPKDATTHMLYAIFLHRVGEKDLALSSYQYAVDLDANNLQIKYNMALLLCDMKKYQEAKTIADVVYARGFPLPGLRRRLEENGIFVP